VAGPLLEVARSEELDFKLISARLAVILQLEKSVSLLRVARPD
jgi:hypothetical protein